MNKRTFWVVAIGMSVLLIAGGLFASNMGFKLNYPLHQPGTSGSLSGTNTVALPFNQQTSLVMASDLNTDIGAGSVVSISKFLRGSDGLFTYPTPDGDFALVPGEGYRVQVSADVDYIVVGSHHPNTIIFLDAPGSNGSVSGTNDYSWPYHSTSTLASELETEMELATPGGVVSISKFLRGSDGLFTYPIPDGDFALVPGTSYRIQVSSNVSFTPSHY
jgi:hypothetical protein